MFAPSLFNRLISVNRSMRINSSFLLSVNIFCRASIASIAVKGVKAPDIHLLINSEFKSSIAGVVFPALARHSALVRYISSVAKPLKLVYIPL